MEHINNKLINYSAAVEACSKYSTPLKLLYALGTLVVVESAH